METTVITIAYYFRLYTIVDYDRILLIEDKVVKEFDHPYQLLANDLDS